MKNGKTLIPSFGIGLSTTVLSQYTVGQGYDIKHIIITITVNVTGTAIFQVCAVICQNIVG
jgi:hypothetical protein